MTGRRAGIAVAASLALVGCGAPAAPVRISDAWVRAAPEGMPSTAAYMTIENRGTTARDITGVTSPAFARGTLHETRVDGGMARMRPVARLALPPGARVSLAPGGLHLMLFAPVQPLRAHDRVPLRLLLADGTAIDVVAEVRAP